MNVSNQTPNLKSPIFTGLLYSIIVMILATIIMSLVIYFTSTEESALVKFAYFIHGISLIVGGFIAGKKAKTKGWYYGGLMGLIYSFFVSLVGFLGYDAVNWMKIMPLLLLGFIVGALGGVIGVNMVK